MRWPMGRRRMSSFSMKRIRIGSAVTAQDMPTPSTNCQVIALGPIQPLVASMATAAALPSSSGMPSARPAVMPLSRRYFQACVRSSSMPAIHTKSITAHQATPLSAVITAGVKTVW
jgi:hypothetical protein